MSAGIITLEESPQNPAQSKVKVEDALSYLDQVKNQFSEESGTYTQFLDIMKDFKNQSIDTPGVIRRVSQLFSGRPQLIMGFNTFLPPGFKVLMNEGSNKIMISEPNGNIQEVCEINATGPPGSTPGIVLPATVASTSASARFPLPPSQGPLEIPNRASADLLLGYVHQQPEPTVQQVITGQIPVYRSASGRLHPEMTVKQQITLQMAANQQAQRLAQQQAQAQATANEAAQAAAAAAAPVAAVKTETKPQISDILNAQAAPAPTAKEERPKQPNLGNAAFDQALEYVNKIKTRFNTQPAVYKSFLDILSSYQKQEKPGTEKTILDAIGKLFENESDLLEEFRIFLPEANLMAAKRRVEAQKKEEQKERGSSAEESDEDQKPESEGAAEQNGESRIDHVLKMEEVQLFEKLRRVLPPFRWNNFLRGLNMYTTKIITEEELFQFVKVSLGEVLPDAVDYFEQLLGLEMEREGEAGSAEQPKPEGTGGPKFHSELAHEIDYNSCKQLGASYRALPDTKDKPVCSGRTRLCRSVLNDKWVSFPSWLSEDSSNVSQKKSAYEEYLHRTEDDRFELDIVMEVNKYAITCLESILKKPKKKEVILDDALGSTSASTIQRAIKRIYGEASFKVIEALKKNPGSAVPRVLERLRQKQNEWKEAKTKMNDIWKEHIEKYFYRAMDHQSNAAKALDAKWMRHKTLIHQIEKLFDERQRRSEVGEVSDEGPHLILMYPSDMTIIHDVNDLLLHHVRRGYQKEEKEKMKEVIRKWIPEWFAVQREPDSEDEEASTSTAEDTPLKRRTRLQEKLSKRKSGDPEKLRRKTQMMWTRPKCSTTYRMVYGANPLFVFFRLHGMVCDRLSKLKKRQEKMIEEYLYDVEMQKKRAEIYEKHGKDIIGCELNASDPFNGLAVFKPPPVNPEKHYERALQEVKNLMDGAMELTTYEDNIRTLFPTELQNIIVMDKFILNMGKQLHQLVTEDPEPFCTLASYQRFRMEKPAKLYEFDENCFNIELAYADHAERALLKENCFKIQIMHKVDDPRVTIELVDTEKELEEYEAEKDKRTADTKRRLEIRKTAKYLPALGEEEYIPSVKALPAPTHLKRNLRKVQAGPGADQKFTIDTTATVLRKPYSASYNPNMCMRMRLGKRTRKERMQQLQKFAKRRAGKIARLCEGHFTESEETVCDEWLNDGLQRYSLFNPDFEFLTYGRYLSQMPE
ncbi:unnamed protein product, partial [Mesorhabditis spiculigera]